MWYRKLREYSINESIFGYIVNLDSDSQGKSNTTLTQYDDTAVCLCCFQSYFAHFNYSQTVLYLFASVISTGVFLKSFIIVSTHCRRHVASETGFKQDSPDPNPDSDLLIECTFLLSLDSDSLCIRIRIC